MPHYTYECSCGWYKDVWQPMRESHEHLRCGACNGTAKRVWTVPQMQVEKTEPYFNYGLGAMVRNKHDVKDAITRVRDTTGQNMVEVGNERVNVKGPELARYPTASELGY